MAERFDSICDTSSAIIMHGPRILCAIRECIRLHESSAFSRADFVLAGTVFFKIMNSHCPFSPHRD